jgi:tetratricopeptide (TPR) repeat protein
MRYLFILLFCSFSALSQEDTVKIQMTLTPEQKAEDDYNKGIEALKRADYNTAAELFSNSLMAKPGFDKALMNRAIAYSNLKRYNEALQDINLAISAKPANADNYFNKSLIYSGMGLRDSQQVALDQCLRLNGEHGDAAYYKGLLSFEAGDYDKAIGYYNIAITTRPNFVFAYNDRGSAKRMKDDYAGAISDYEKAISLDSNSAFIYNNLGTALRMNKEFDKARRAYSIALSKDKNYSIALLNRGAAAFEKGDLKAAQADFEEVLASDPKNSLAYNNLSSIALKSNDYKKARDLASRAISLDGKNGAAYYNRGIARQMLREEEGCCADWKKALELGVSGAKNFINATCLD